MQGVVVSWPDMMAAWYGEGPVTDLDTGTEAVVVEAARAVWNRSCAGQRWESLEAADDLVRALDTYDAIHAGAVHPAAWWPELEHDPEPWDTGLRRAAEAVLRQLAEVIKQAPALAGDAP
jgi:hypothetical protein